MFQSILLRRHVLFCGDTRRIHSSSMRDHCSQETVRVLKDPLTGALSILYFASNRGASNALAGFMDIPGTIVALNSPFLLLFLTR